MKFTFHPGAQQDIFDASDHYETQANLIVAARFLEELNRVVLRLAEFPGLGTPMSKTKKIFPLKTFPYSIIYRDLGDRIRILAVKHQHRRPGYGGSRQ